MNITILLFGIVTDLVGASKIVIHTEASATIKSLKKQLILTYPSLKNINTFAIAVNENYADDDTLIKEGDIIAIIPPVSGG